MRVRHLAHLTATLALATACSDSTETPEEVIEASPIAGMYEVSGTTIETQSGNKRGISGTIILAEDSGKYTATFNLNTTFPGPEKGIAAEVIGTGSGDIEGRTLRGTAQMQIVMATVPGVDPGFAFIPRTTSTRVESSSVTTIAADGTVSIVIENRPAPGQDYVETRTTRRGMRVSGAGVETIRGTPAAKN
jgi:hypothetical protein